MFININYGPKIYDEVFWLVTPNPSLGGMTANAPTNPQLQLDPKNKCLSSL
jgi:hypothetical protein